MRARSSFVVLVVACSLPSACREPAPTRTASGEAALDASSASLIDGAAENLAARTSRDAALETTVATRAPGSAERIPSAEALAAVFRGTNARGFVAVTGLDQDGSAHRVIVRLPRREEDDAGTPAPARAVPIASFTKLWTAVVALRLVARGQLALADRIDAVLPALASRRWSSSTLFQLMTHTSSVPEFDVAGGYFKRRDVDFGHALAVLEKHVPQVTEKAGVFNYRNAEYAIVGAMIEARAGAPLADVMRAELFAPARMTRSGLLVGAVPADVDVATLGTIRAQNFFAAAAGYSTPEDLLAFFEALAANTLLDDAQKATLFDGAKERGYGALGCWVSPFTPTPRTGGASYRSSVPLVERQGALGDMKLFAAFVPGARHAVVAWSGTSVDFGHPYRGRGLGFSLVNLLFE